MSEEPYLVAHKVRGEPAFDIAIKLPCAVCRLMKPLTANAENGAGADFECDECDDTGVWWIIPTSGHRATPWWTESLSAFARQDMDGSCNKLDFIPEMPEGWPDHYPCNPTPQAPSLFSRISGLIKREPIKRRV